MPLPSMPALDANVCGDWTENQINAYQSMPFYLAKIQVDVKQTYSTFSKIVGKRKWTQKMGPILRGVRTNASPNLRQFAYPQPLTSVPLTDVMDIRETTTEAQVRWQDFQSPIFNFYPEFNDFLSHIEDNGKDIAKKIERYNEVFLRGMMFQMSPFMFICNVDGSVSLETCPFWNGSGTFDPNTQGKIANYLSNENITPDGPLDLSCIEQAMTIMETDLGVPFFSGSEMPKADGIALDGKFLIILDSEAYNRWTFDKYVLQGRSIDLNLINNGFRGSLWGRGTTRLESLPLRYNAAGTFPAPELRAATTEYDSGETLPSPLYAQPANAPYGVAWICGQNGYEAIETGPPPALFTGDKFPNAPGMDWSGVPKLTKNFLLQCLDPAGVVQTQANTFGRYVKFIAEQTFGILATQRRNMIPIVYKRKRGPGNPLV